MSTEVATIEHNGLSVIDLNGKLPDLSKADIYPFDLMADYWTPETPGENKRVIFDRIAERAVKDQQSDEVIDLECAFFLEQQSGGDFKTVSNGSKRLVGALQAHRIQKGTPLLITYLGKRSNRTNAFKSDSWSVKPLRINI